MTEHSVLNETTEKLDVLVRLVGCSLAARTEEPGEQQKDQIEAFHAAGMPNPLIADLLATTSGTVRATLSRRKKPTTRRRTNSSS